MHGQLVLHGSDVDVSNFSILKRDVTNTASEIVTAKTVMHVQCGRKEEFAVLAILQLDLLEVSE